MALALRWGTATFAVPAHLNLAYFACQAYHFSPIASRLSAQ